MKQAIRIFSYLGLVFVLGFFVGYLLKLDAAGRAGEEVLGLTYLFFLVLVVCALGVVMAINILDSVKVNQKKTWVGVVSIFCLSPIAGVLYLMWDGVSE